MNRYRNIIWDWNGTLVDDVWLCVEALTSILRRRNMSLVNRYQYVTEFSHPVRDYYQRLGFDLSIEPFESLTNEFNAIYDSRKYHCKLQPSAERMLDYCTNAGFTQVILSAYQQTELRQSVHHFNLQNHFTDICGLDDFSAGNKREVAIALVKHLQFDNTETLLIGDTLHDFEVAQIINCDCVLVENGHNSRNILNSCGVRVLGTLAEVEALL